ncbi:hypothetical protein EV44_g4069 [Erysiphe necator]|uniref:Uncharacterized protein n=1 Tax=Uncinula necator TaxID=52586 RepID=A0A0B1NZG0_UNCNE|nr:hypothetical protein EV44_g4069 [Erysiphe necator]
MILRIFLQQLLEKPEPDLSNKENSHEWTLDEINAAADSFSIAILSPKLLKQLENNSSLENKSELVDNKIKNKNEIKSEYLTPKSPPTHISIDQIPQIVDQDNNLSISRQSSQCFLTKYNKEIANLSKSYEAEQKYGGTGDNIDHKITIFYHLCARNGIPEEAHAMALSVMLKDFALDHYSSANLSQ